MIIFLLILFIISSILVSLLEYKLFILLQNLVINSTNISASSVLVIGALAFTIFFSKTLMFWSLARFSRDLTLKKTLNFVNYLGSGKLGLVADENLGLLDNTNSLQAYYNALCQILSSLFIIFMFIIQFNFLNTLTISIYVLIPITIVILLNIYIRKSQRALGEELNIITELRLRKFINFSSNILVSKMYSLTTCLMSDFMKVEKSFRSTRLKIYMWALSPRLILDLIALVSALLFLYFAKITTEQLAGLAIIFIRLAPYISSIFSNYSKVTAYFASTKTLRNDTFINSHRHKTNHVRTEGLSNFDQNTLICGGSGTGKTTMLLEKFGVYRNVISDEALFTEKVETSAIFFQRTPELDLTLGEFISLIKLEDLYVNRLEVKLDDTKIKLSQLSGGELQRLWLVAAFSKNSKYLYLDEPTNNLDNATISKLLTLLDSDKRQKIIISHDLKLIDYCRERKYKIISLDNENI